MAYFIWLCFILAFFLLLSKYDVFKTKTEPGNNEPKDDDPLSSYIDFVQANNKHKAYWPTLIKFEKELKILSNRVEDLKDKFEINRLLPLIEAERLEEEWANEIFESCNAVLNLTQDHSWDKELDLDFYRNIRSEQSLEDVLHFKCTKCNLQLKWNGDLVRWDDSAPNINPYYNASEDIPSCKEHIMNQALE